MQAEERDLAIIQKIYKYCTEIDDAHLKFGKSYDSFKNDTVYKNAVSLCIMQIGELSNHISEDFKAKNDFIPWREIRGMRNVVAHEYGNIDTEIVWETATENIAQIKEFCERILNR
ncbi:MAG: DUF86 domain-containing protein [Oscillospiraceae bacterium]|nr:DUF86 domain-containing protein [Candidatus Equicaccousia limihippi]